MTDANRLTDRPPNFGTVPEQWKDQPEAWIDYLRFKADRCQALRPDLAEDYREAANLLEDNGE